MTEQKIIIKNQSAKGLNSWLMIMVSVFCCLLLIENVKRFGIRKDPFEITIEVFNMIIGHGWFYGVIMICLIQQTIQMFFLEKLLAKKNISEKLGMSLHALNTLFLPTASIVMITKFSVNKVFARLLMMYIMFTAIKSWSFAYVNSTYRKIHQQRKSTNLQNIEVKKSLVPYPRNVTLNNAITYMIFTAPIPYKDNFSERKNPDFKQFSKLIFQLILVYYGISFLALQLIIPDLQFLKSPEACALLDKLLCVLRISLPLNLVWLLYHYQNFRAYLPAYAALTGMEDITFSSDWWNSAHLNEFWRKWNIPIYEWLKYSVVLPLIQSGYSRRVAKLVAFLVAGIIHEYLNTLPFGVYNGFGFFLTIIEIPAGALSEYIAKRFGKQYGNITLWIYLITCHSVAMVYLCLSYDNLFE